MKYALTEEQVAKVLVILYKTKLSGSHSPLLAVIALLSLCGELIGMIFVTSLIGELECFSKARRIVVAYM